MRKLTIILVALTAVLLAGYAGYRGYKVWKQNHMMALAKGFLAKSDGRNALLSLQQVLRANPAHLEATRLMAQLTEAARSPSALLWRSRVVELSPRSADDRLALAQTAMMFRDYRAATNALEGVDAAGKQTFRYQNLAGTIAGSAGQIADAEAHFREAAHLEPSNLVPQLNLAVIHLQTSNDLDRAEARIMLRRISLNVTNANLRSLALRELINDAARSRDTNNALALSKQLVAQTNAVFADKLIQLEVLRQARSAELNPTLAALQRAASTNIANLYELAIWQIPRIPPADTLAWLRSLPPATRTNQPAALLIAECLSNAKDWPGLQATLESQAWGELEFIRHAFLTLAQRNQGLTAGAKGEWELALKTANSQRATLAMLLRLAAQWNWATEAEELLWTIVNRYPDQKWAVQALTQALYAGGRTRPLMMLFNQEFKRSPADLSVKNNLALTALLLDAKELKPHEMARDVFSKAPTNAAFASTYAFSLYLQEKNADALKAMQTLPAKALEDPSIAGYYGLILKAAGDKAKARSYLDAAFKAPMLPEERKMFEQARAGA